MKSPSGGPRRFGVEPLAQRSGGQRGGVQRVVHRTLGGSAHHPASQHRGKPQHRSQCGKGDGQRERHRV